MPYNITIPSFHIKNISNDDYGHCNYLDVITLKNDMVVIVGAEAVSVHKSIEDFNNGIEPINTISTT